MSDLLRATFLIFRAQLWRTLRSRRTLVCAGLAAVPVLLALIVTLLPASELPERLVRTAGQRIAWNLVIQGLVPLLSLIGGAAVVSEEIEDRTITYLLTSPIPRAAILLGRWSASFVWLGLLVAGSLAGVLALLGASPSRAAGVVPGFELFWTLLAIGTIGCGVYSAGFAALGARIKHPMIVGLAYTFAIEVFLTNLPGKTRSATVQFYLRSMANEWAEPYFKRMQNFRRTEFDPGDVALLKMTLLLAVALALGSWILSRRQYVMSS